MEGIELVIKKTSDIEPPVPIVKGKRVLLQVDRLYEFEGAAISKRKMDFIIGAPKKKLVRGFETVLSQLNCGDQCEVRIESEHAYGKVGQSWEIKPDEDLFFRIDVLEVGEPSEQQTFQALSDEEKYAHSLKLKEEANVHFKAGDMKAAIEIYKQSEQGLLEMKRHTAEVRTLFKSVFMNMSVASNKIGDYEHCINCCSRALDIDGTAVKALYLRAQAFVATKNFDRAQLDAKAGIKLSPCNPDLRTLWDQIKKDKLAWETKNHKGFADNMFGKEDIYEQKEKKNQSDQPDFDIEHPQVFMDIQIDNKLLGRVVFELFRKDLPVTTENFRALCTGELKDKARNLTYQDRKVKYIIAGEFMQGGAIVKENALGAQSIYGGRFKDEGKWIKHSQKGLLTTCNLGPNTNGSEFFVTFGECPKMDEKNTVFGRVIQGYKEVMGEIEKNKVYDNGVVCNEINIYKCGEIKADRKLKEHEVEPLI